jgi:hypothetical protein
METFLEPLVLKQKPRLGIQLVSSLVIILFAVFAYISLPSIVEGYTCVNDGQKTTPSLGIIIALFIFALIPGAFIFMLMKNNLKFE